jgi:hypothetical protein
VTNMHTARRASAPQLRFTRVRACETEVPRRKLSMRAHVCAETVWGASGFVWLHDLHA